MNCLLEQNKNLTRFYKTIQTRKITSVVMSTKETNEKNVIILNCLFLMNILCCH